MTVARRLTVAAAAAVTAAVAAFAFAFAANDDPPGRATSDVPKIYGAAAPAAAPTVRRRPVAREAEDVARRWTQAWNRIQVCAHARAQLRTVLSLSSGKLAAQLATAPPRVAYDARCDPKRLVGLRVFPTGDGGARVLVENAGETGGPLTLTLIPTDRGLRVVTIDY